MARIPSLFIPGSMTGAGIDLLMTLHRKMNRLFYDVAQGGSVPGGNQGFLPPSMDVSETEKEIRIQAELPGAAEKDIEVSLHDDVLTVHAERKQEHREEREGVHLSERSFGTVQRSPHLPYQVNPDQVEVRFENGVLTIALPKSAPEQRNRITIGGSKPTSAVKAPNAQSNGQPQSGTQAIAASRPS